MISKTLLFSTVALVGTLALAPQHAGAASITINSTTPAWSNFVGGTNDNTTTSGSGNSTVYQARWGVPAFGGQQSGLGFDPATPPQTTYATDTTFLLGTLFHYNNPINGGTAASSVDLGLSTNIQSAIPTNQTFAYRFLINETPNTPPCQFPSTTPCADQITFVNLDTSNFFTVGGVAYTIQLTGFSTDNGLTFTNDFISQEGGTNSAGLYARITAPTPITPVPAPGGLMAFGIGLLALGMARRFGPRRQTEA